jgi:hypothetical protein
VPVVLSLEPVPEDFSPGARCEGPDLLPGRPGTLLESCDGDAGGAVEEPLEPMLLLEPELRSFAAGPDLLPGWPGTPGFDTPPEPGAFCICSSDFDDGLVVVCDQAGNAAVINAAAAAKLTIFLMAHLVAATALPTGAAAAVFRAVMLRRTRA